MSTVSPHVQALSRGAPRDLENTPALSARTLLILAVALLVPAVASVWLMAAPETVTPSTYAIGATVVVALAALALLPRLKVTPW